MLQGQILSLMQQMPITSLRTCLTQQAQQPQLSMQRLLVSSQHIIPVQITKCYRATRHTALNMYS